MTRSLFATRPLTLVAVLAVVLGVACDRSPDGSPTETASATARPSVTATATRTPWPIPTPEPTPESRRATPEELNALSSETRLGEPAFDAIVDAVVEGDVDAVMAAIAWEVRECAVDYSDGPPSPPPCLDGEAEGTLVESIPFVDGESSYPRPEQVRERLEAVFAEERPLCELLRVDDVTRGVALRKAELWTVVERGSTTDAALVTTFSARVVEGMIVQLGDNGEALLQNQIGCRGVYDIP